MLEQVEITKREKRGYLAALACFLTAIFGWITVWSLNGTYVGSEHVVNDIWTNEWTISPFVQGFLAFITLIMVFVSVNAILSYHLQKEDK